uniref:peptidoglycan DD-metalloendopeptidase family protein n=1 Tax=Acetatifactor sp. TaxID=1872090 RepID=UPI004057A6B2
MRRNRKSNIKRERIVMIASSAFVLAALTMTGVYMKEKNVESKDDGYSVDFEAMEDSVDNKFQEIAQNEQNEIAENQVAQNDSVTDIGVEPSNLEDDLDYMPLEAGSSQVEIPGLTDGTYSLGTVDSDSLGELAALEAEEDLLAEVAEEVNEEAAEEEVSAQNVVIAEEVAFSETDSLIRPLEGEVLMPFSMDGSIYFATLDQYKYNPAVMFSAEEGSAVSACADGRVADIYDDAQLGHVVVLDLGNGYQATYGQVKDIQVTLDSYVEAGETIASVAAPTKYFSVEGSNLYFQLTKDGEPVNPETMF